MNCFLTDISGASYTFNASTRRVTFSGVSLTLDRILAIINVTRNVVIYDPTSSSKGGSLSGSVLTLTYNTAGHSNSDALIIKLNVDGNLLKPYLFAGGQDGITATSSSLVVSAIQYASTNGASSGNDRLRVPSSFVNLNAVNISAITSIWTPAVGKRFRFMGGTFSVSANASVLFEDNSAGSFIFRTPILEANKPYTIPYIGNGRLSGLANRILKATASVASSITGTIFGTEE